MVQNIGDQIFADDLRERSAVIFTCLGQEKEFSCHPLSYSLGSLGGLSRNNKSHCGKFGNNIKKKLDSL